MSENGAGSRKLKTGKPNPKSEGANRLFPSNGYNPHWVRGVELVARSSQVNAYKVALEDGLNVRQKNSRHTQLRRLKAAVLEFPNTWSAEVVEMVKAGLLGFQIEEGRTGFTIYAVRKPDHAARVREILAKGLTGFPDTNIPSENPENES